MFRPRCNGNGYGQPHPTTNYHRTHSGEHVSKVAQRPCHPGGAVLQHQVVHKESFKEVDGPKAPAKRRYFDNNYPVKANNVMAANHHRYEVHEETYEETCEEETYAYGGGRHFEYEIRKETYEEEEDEVVVGGGGCAQLRRPHCRA